MRYLVCIYYIGSIFQLVVKSEEDARIIFDLFVKLKKGEIPPTECFMVGDISAYTLDPNVTMAVTYQKYEGTSNERAVKAMEKLADAAEKESRSGEDWKEKE